MRALPWLLLCALVGAAGTATARDTTPLPGMAATAPHCVAVPQDCVAYQHPNHANCGTRGGPGCRKPNGQCAAWRDGYTPNCRVTQRPPR